MRRRRQNGRVRSPWARRRRRATAVLAALGLCLLPALIWRISTRAELNQRFANLREAELPVTLDELKAWHARSHDVERSEETLRGIFERYTDVDIATLSAMPSFERRDVRLLEVPYAGPTRAALETRVSGNEAMLQHLMAAAALPRIQLIYELDPRQPANGSDLQRPLEVLCAYACLQAARGDGEGAMDALLAGFQIARACRLTNSTGMLNRVIGYDFMLAAVLESVAVRVRIPEVTLAEIEALIADDSWERDLVYAANGDRCFHLSWDNSWKGPKDALFGIAGVYDRAKLRILDYYGMYADIAVMPMEERMGYLEETGMVYDYSYCRPPLSRAYSPLPVAVLRYFYEEGRFPAQLEALTDRFLSPGALDDTREVPAYSHDGHSFTLGGESWIVSVPGHVNAGGEASKRATQS